MQPNVKASQMTVILWLKWDWRRSTTCLPLPIIGVWERYCESKKTRHPTHVDNFSKNWSIFKILLLINSKQNFLQNKYCIAHHTLQVLLHYLVNCNVSKIVYIQKYIIEGRGFEVFLQMYLLRFFFSSN